MRRYVAFFLATLFLAGCGWMAGAPASDPPPLRVARGEAFWLSIGQTAHAPDGAMLTFEAIVEDSRCPADVACVWGGVASVSVVPSEPNVRYRVPDTLSTGDLREGDHSQIGPFRLLDVRPAPRADGPAPAPEAYRGQFIIE